MMSEAGKELEARRQRLIVETKQATAPVLEELRGVGYGIDSLDDLRHSGIRYEAAIPILVRWLPRVNSTDAKEGIVRALSVPWAKGIAGPILIDEFMRTSSDDSAAAHALRWSIGNALEVIADKALLDSLVKIAANKKYGTSRQMAVLALGKVRDPKSVDLLIRLLDDEDVVGHAVKALGKLAGGSPL